MSESAINSAIHDPERLQALRRLDLLDTPPEESFDRVTRLAAKLLEVPVARVALMDKDRMFFKSVVVETPTSILPTAPSGPSDTLAKHPVTFQEPFVIEDARDDPRTKNSDAVRRAGIVAFAAVPLTDGQGHALGALCALDDKPHVWTAQQVEILQDLGGVVESIIRSRAAAVERVQSQPALPRLDGADGAGSPKLDGVDRLIHKVGEYLRRVDAADQGIRIGRLGALAESSHANGELEEAVQATRRELVRVLKEFRGGADGAGEVQSARTLLGACETYCDARQRRAEVDRLFQQQQATLGELRTAAQAVIGAEEGLRIASLEYSAG